jgi:hypothetical protein
MRVVPLAAVPSQTLAIVLDGQNAQIALRQNGSFLYFSLSQDDSPIVTTRICRDRQLLLVDARYRGFKGDFLFVDQQGDTDPTFTGLGARYQLVFVSASEIAPT